MKHDFKTFDVATVNKNGVVISKDALKDQDGKPVPLKWGSGKHAEIIGTAELNVCGDGVSISMDEETYTRLIKMTKEN